MSPRKPPRYFAKQGLKIITGIEIGDVKISQKGVSIDYTDKDGNEQKLDADRLIVSIGRIPNTDGLGCRQVGLKLTDRGQIEVDAHCRTNLPGVWAVGDVVAGPMLAHKAMEEGVMVAEIMAVRPGTATSTPSPG
jgi:dihydrolipoamide dehydrogenase